MTISLNVNGQEHAIDVDPATPLLYVLREDLRLNAAKFGCGMGQCGTCTSHILAGGEHLPPPNWKEQKILGERLKLGYRLCCQLWITQDLALTQENLVPATPPCTSS